MYKELDKKKKDDNKNEPSSFSADSPVLNNAPYMSSVPQLTYYPANEPLTQQFGVPIVNPMMNMVIPPQMPFGM